MGGGIRATAVDGGIAIDDRIMAAAVNGNNAMSDGMELPQ